MPDAARQVILTAQGGTEKPSQLYVEDREAWRSWLAANHSRPGGVWLVLYHKKSGVPTVTYDEAVEEALCFGWVDSRANKRDGESYVLYFTSRNPKSNWSSANRQQVERMMEQGRMTEAGLGLVKLAKESGAWTALREVQESVIPPDLSEALAAGDKAEEDRGDGAPRRAEHQGGPPSAVGAARALSPTPAVPSGRRALSRR